MPKAATIDQFLRNVSPDKRAALERLRGTIRAAAPEAEECISYGVPGFRLDGKLLVSFGAGKTHCAFYPGAAPIETYRDELARWETSKGTIRFQPDDPLPASLIRKVVKSRIAEQSVRKAKG